MSDQAGVGKEDRIRNEISGTVYGSVIQAQTVVQVSEEGEVRSRPKDLGANAPHFTNREKEQEILDELLGVSVTESQLVCVCGQPGIGKTALLRHWARRVCEAFPDAVLSTDLNAYGRGPRLSTSEALRSWLEVLGVPKILIPESLAGRISRLRTNLDGLRVLVLIDNVDDAEAVRALRATSAGTLTVVTSRKRLRSLGVHDGAVHLSMKGLSRESSRELLAAMVGHKRLDEAPAAAERLVDLCEGVPILLCVAAERVSGDTGTSLGAMVERLGDSNDQLDEWSAGEDDTVAVRRVLSWSYDNLSVDQRRLFALLGLHPTEVISVGAGAALAGLDHNAARRALDVLADNNLIEALLEGARYQQHNVLHAYAAERAAVDLGQPETLDAVRRMLAWYLHTADEADQLIAPQRPRQDIADVERPLSTVTFNSRDEAVAWCELERTNLRGAVEEAARRGFHGIAWRLPTALWNFFYLRKHWEDWIGMHQVGLLSARALGDKIAESAMLNNLGGAYRQTHQLRRALGCYEAALRIRREVPSADQGRGLAGTLNDIAETLRTFGRAKESLPYYEEALAISRRRGDRWGEGIFLNNLAEAYIGLKDFERAISLFEEALLIRREVRHGYGEAWTINDLGEAYLGAGEVEVAERYLFEALNLRRELNDEYGEAWTLHVLGDVAVARGDFEGSVDYYERAQTIRVRLGDKWGTGRTLARLGTSLFRLSNSATAREHWREAKALLEEVQDPEAEIVERMLSSQSGR